MNQLVSQFRWYMAGNSGWTRLESTSECPHMDLRNQGSQRNGSMQAGRGIQDLAAKIQHSSEVHSNQKLAGQVCCNI